MKLLKSCVILLAIVLAVIVIAPIVYAVNYPGPSVTLTDAQVAALDVNTIQLPQLHFDNSQAKVIVDPDSILSKLHSQLKLPRWQCHPKALRVQQPRLAQLFIIRREE